MTVTGNPAHNRTRRLIRLAAVLPVLGALFFTSGPARATSLHQLTGQRAGVPVQADLTLSRIKTNLTSAAVGDRLVFKAAAHNLGPGTSQLNVTYSDARHVGITREVCLVPPSEAGDIDTPSPDTPSCEFSAVPAGDVVMVKVIAIAADAVGKKARLTFCTSDGSGVADPDPANDCKTARIPIAAS